MYKRCFLLFCITLVGCDPLDTTLPGDERMPRCEARSNVDPARLNIDSDGEGYGLVKPCRSHLDFGIAAATNIRFVSGKLTVYGEQKPSSYDYSVSFGEKRSGFLVNHFEIPGQENDSCDELKVSIDSLECFDHEKRPIECPAIRLKTSLIFGDLWIEAGSLDVCFDN